MKTESSEPQALPVEKNHSPSTSVKVWSVIFFVTPFALFGYWMFQVRQEAKAKVLSVPVESLSFGTVWMQDDFEWTIPVTNLTNREVEILGFASSCNCTSIQPKKCSLVPGETLDLRLVINLESNSTEAIEMIRSFSVLITPVIKGELSRSHSWVVEGRVRSTVEASVASLNFEDIVASNQDFTPKYVKFIADRQVDKIEVSCEEQYGIAKIRQIDPAKRVHELTVTLSESIPIGRFGFAVTIHAFEKNGNPLQKMNFPVLGRLRSDVRAIPPNLDFSSLKNKEVKRDSVILSSLSGSRFRVVKVDLDESAGIALKEKNALPREASTGKTVFQIEQTALKLSSQTTTITFHVRENTSKRVVKIPVVVSYYGRDSEENGGR